jgi:amino acid transporter
MTAVCGMISWSAILYTSIRFNRGLRAQGIDRSTLPYRAPLQPFLSYYGFVVSIIVIIFSGFTAFMHHFDTSSFITTYFGIPFFLVLLLGYKFFHRTRMIRTDEMDFVTGHSRDIDEEKEREPGVWGWIKANI